MKNIHILPTDKPSRLYKLKATNKFILHPRHIQKDFYMKSAVGQNIYITSDKEIKEGDWALDLCEDLGLKYEAFKVDKATLKYANQECQKIILTDDEDLIKDGVQVIDDEFLEWFVKNPSCEWVETEIVEYGFDEVPIYNYKIIIPKEEPKFENSIDNTMNIMSIANSMFGKKEEPKQDLEKEMFELEQELDIPSHLRWHNSKPKQETLEPIVYNIGDNIIIINPTENQPKSFTTHKVDNNFGVVYYYQLDGKEESIGFSHIKKEEPKQDLEKEIFELEQELPKTEIDWSGFPKSTQEKVGYVEPKQETLEEVKKYISNKGYGKGSNFTLNNVANLMIKWQQEQDKNKFSEEKINKILQKLEEIKIIINIR